MKIEHIDEDNIIVFLNKLKTKEKILLSNNFLEQYFRNLFQNIKKKYHIDINGYYTVTLYQDSLYGVIVDIKKDLVDYFDYYENHVDMKIDISKNTTFLYKMDNLSLLSEKLYPYINVYIYRNNIYVKPKKNIDQISLGSIIENSTIIYDNLCDDILKFGKKIKSKYIFV